MSNEQPFSMGPHSPAGSRAVPTLVSFAAIRNRMTAAPINLDVSRCVDDLLDAWHGGRRNITPFLTIQAMLDRIRAVPVGDERVYLMSSVVRSLGRPHALASFLDMLRWAALRRHPVEDSYMAMLQNVRMHSIYGWCGNTMLVESGREPLASTYPVPPGLAERLDNPASSWNLTLHVWQPNTRARGFTVLDDKPAASIAEPPHSHPFDFVSSVVTGRMQQSIYRQVASVLPRRGRYADVALEHVDGVWPPHDHQSTVGLDVLEERVVLAPGDTYYMPCDMIHDVEIDPVAAVETPTITLFLSSEYMVMPHVYMTRSMIDYHIANPNIKTLASPIPTQSWHAKLEAISNYLTGRSKTLRLPDIVQFDGEYAFFHI